MVDSKYILIISRDKEITDGVPREVLRETSSQLLLVIKIRSRTALLLNVSNAKEMQTTLPKILLGMYCLEWFALKRYELVEYCFCIDLSKL